MKTINSKTEYPMESQGFFFAFSSPHPAALGYRQEQWQPLHGSCNLSQALRLHSKLEKAKWVNQKIILIIKPAFAWEKKIGKYRREANTKQTGVLVPYKFNRNPWRRQLSREMALLTRIMKISVTVLKPVWTSDTPPRSSKHKNKYIPHTETSKVSQAVCRFSVFPS